MSSTAGKTREMNPVALLTPTYGRDLELCALLCESVDRHVSSFSKHYLLVPDCDLPLFAHFESERRCVLPASKFLPKWLRPLPRIIQRNRRQYWWSFRTAPVSGWHVQQLLKIAAAIALPEQRYCILDSDVVFFRDFDLSRFEYPNPIPLLNRPDEVTSDHIRHSHWIETTPSPARTANAAASGVRFHRSCHFLGPGDDARDGFDKSRTSPASIGSRRLCRTRGFSEYMLYGYFAQSDANFSGRHSLTSRTPCISYWDQPQLGRDELNALLRRAEEDDVAFSVASFSGTPVEIIRAAIEETAAHGAPITVAK